MIYLSFRQHTLPLVRRQRGGGPRNELMESQKTGTQINY